MSRIEVDILDEIKTMSLDVGDEVFERLYDAGLRFMTQDTER